MNKRRIFMDTFMKAGWWPKRVTKENWNGQVFRRSLISRDGYSYSYNWVNGKQIKTRAGTRFTKVKSDVVIPVEMVQGIAGQAWRNGARRLQPRIEHEIRVMTKRIVT